MGERDSHIPSVLKSPKIKTASKPLSRRVSFNDKDPETLFEPKRQVPTPAAATAEDSGPSTGVNYGPGPFHTNPIGGQSVYLPSPIAHFSSFPTFNTTAHQPYLPYTPFHTNITPAPIIAMGDYQNTSPPNIGLNFQPPVPDTTYGPMQHTYVPRFDNGAFIVNPNTPGGNCPQNVAFLPSSTSYATVAQQPGLIQQPVMMSPQPVIMSGQPVQAMPAAVPFANISTPIPAAGVPLAAGMAPGVGMTVPVVTTGNNPASTLPDVMGVGKTAGEVAKEQLEFAYQNQLFEPQDFKPADDDPSRFYYVREVDGNWTQRNRFTIDNLGDCRWFIAQPEGYFYAVRMKD